MEHLKSSFNWDEYYLILAFAASLRSKDPSSKVGAVIVKGSTVVPGYNGFPRGIDDLAERWERPHKYDYVVHAESNALSNAQFDVTGSTMYITHHPPCSECAKLIIQRGIKNIICGDLTLSSHTLEKSKTSLEMLFDAGIDIKRIPSRQIYNKAMVAFQIAIERMP